MCVGFFSLSNLMPNTPEHIDQINIKNVLFLLFPQMGLLIIDKGNNEKHG